MELGTSVNLYYNLYDQTKGYTEILFRAGKVLQSKELNELQSMLKHQIKNVGDTVLTNGDIIEGCQLVINGTNVTLTKGRMYLDGDVREVPDTNFTITGQGTEVIGVKLNKIVVDHDQDLSLLDVATGYDNFNLDGAFRLKEVIEVTVNDSTATIIYTLTDGMQMKVTNANDSEVSQFEKIQNTLARRTFDESGNYKVSGLKIIDRKYNDEENIYISVEPGKAYVRGYEVILDASRSVAIERPLITKKVNNEIKIFKSGIKEYMLNYNYITELRNVVASVTYTNNTMTKSGTDFDYLRVKDGDDTILGPAISITKISYGDTVYQEGTDFRLTATDSTGGIEWLTANRPESGMTYTVTWVYSREMIRGTDFKLKKSSGYDFVEFIGDVLPNVDSEFRVDYTFALCRRDTISLDKDGAIVVTQGQPDVMRLVESPTVDGNQVLVLGSILVKPESDSILIINNNTKTIPMLDLYKMLDRINALEYNQAISDLDQEAAAGENATELLGVLTDGFIGFTKSDYYHLDWDACIDLDNQELTLPFTTYTNKLQVIQDEDFKGGLFGRMLTAPYKEVKLLSQTQATGTIRINPYNSFPKRPSLTLDPAVDNWIDYTIEQYEDETLVNEVSFVKTWWDHKDDTWAAEEKALWDKYGLNAGNSSTTSTDTVSWTSGNTTTTTTTANITTTSIANSVKEELIMYMRENTVQVVIENLEPNVDNVYGIFDGKQIALTPLNSTYKGTVDGTLKADATGVAKGSFTIPANTICGIKELYIFPENTPSLVGKANYTSYGRTKVVTSNVTTSSVFTESTAVATAEPVAKVIKRIVADYNPGDGNGGDGDGGGDSDPISQSFQFDIDQYLTAVGFYVSDKDSKEPLVVQIRNMVNGYPGSTKLAEKVIAANRITRSSNGSVETKVTFDNPVYCKAGEQYCMTILTNSDVDSVFLAETGNTDINTGELVAKNAYFNGTLFSSSNALTWTAHQSQDLKFNIYGAEFSEKGVAVFERVTNVTGFDRLMIASNEDIPSGCKVTWKYAINEGDWNPIETYDDRALRNIAYKVDVKVEIVAMRNTSPAIALDSLLLAGFVNKMKCSYVSRNVYVADGFNTVKQIIDINTNSVSGVEPIMYYAIDESGSSWQAMPPAISSTQKNAEFTTYTFEQELGQVAHNYRAKVVLKTNTPVNVAKAKNLRSIMKMV